MNKITSNVTGMPIEFRCGDIFKCRDGVYYILARCNSWPSYVAVSLAHGNGWLESHRDINEAVAGLVFVGRNLNIEIKVSD